MDFLSAILRRGLYAPFLYPFLLIVVFVFFVIPRQENEFLPWVVLELLAECKRVGAIFLKCPLKESKSR